MRQIARTLLVLFAVAVLLSLTVGRAAHKAIVITPGLPAHLAGKAPSAPPAGLPPHLFVSVGGTPILSHSATQEVPLASLTKIMTAYVVLTSPRIYPLTKTIRFTANDLYTGEAMRVDQGDSVVLFKAGQDVSIKDMLYALLLPSGDNIATLLADAYPGGQSAFVARMNADASKLGLTGARFTEPSGLDPGDVASARDIALLSQAAMDIPTFARVVATRSYSVAGASPNPMLNLNQLLGQLPGAIGIKTGWTPQAGHNLAWAVRTRLPGNPVLIAVELGTPGPVGAFGPVFQSAASITAYGEGAVTVKKITRGTTVATAKLGLGLTVPLKAASTVYLVGPGGAAVHFAVTTGSPGSLPTYVTATIAGQATPIPVTGVSLPLWFRVARAL